LSVLLIRTAILVVLLTVPFLLLAFGQGKSDGLLWLMFPIVLFVPAVLGSFLLLAPFEALIAKLGWNANIALPIFGALLGAAVVAVALATARNSHALVRLSEGDPSTWGAMVGIVFAGAAIGVAWRATLWIAKTADWA
jgi:hypothetical protein